MDSSTAAHEDSEREGSLPVGGGGGSGGGGGGGGGTPSAAVTLPPIPPCPLALQPFTMSDWSELCPTLLAYLRQVPGEPPTIPSLKALQSLQRDLEALSNSTSQRARALQEELAKAESFVKARIKEERKATALTSGASGISTIAAPSSGQTIKLDLKKLKSATIDGGDADVRSLSGRSGPVSPQMKRKRDTSVDSEQSDVVRNSTRDGASPAPSAGRDKISSYQKKKQRLAQRERSSSTLLQDSVAADGVNLPKPIAEETSKVKPSSQISIAVFWNYVDAFFKNVTEEDLPVLIPTKHLDPMALIIPPLGRHYTETWAEEDRLLNPTIPEKGKPSSKGDFKAASVLDDSSLVPEEAFCGPLTERLIASLMEDEVDASSTNADKTDSSDARSDSPPIVRTTQQIKEEMYDIEERLKSELRFVGLLEEHEVGIFAEESDEISTELRSLQAELRRIVELNNQRKSVVYELALDQMAYQEYSNVVDELDKQIDQAFQKRAKTVKKKKKTTGGIYVKPAPDGIAALLERRKRLVHEFKPIFPQKLRLSPADSVFGDEPAWASSANLLNIVSRSEAMQEAAVHAIVVTPKLHTTLPVTTLPSETLAPFDHRTINASALPASTAAASATTTTKPGEVAGKTIPAPGVDASGKLATKGAKPAKPRKPKKSEGGGGQVAGKTRPGMPAGAASPPTLLGLEGVMMGMTTDAGGLTMPGDTPPKKPRKKYTRKKKTDEAPTSSSKTLPGGGTLVKEEDGDTEENYTKPAEDTTATGLNVVPDWMYGLKF